MRNIVPDVREALRQWRRTPGITVAALLSLILGIGASTAIFSLLNALLLKSLPVREPQQIVTFRDDRSPTVLNLRISYPMFTSLARNGAGLEAVAAYAAMPVNLSPIGAPVRNARALFVSGSYFDLLGVGASAGRMLAPADDDPAAPSRHVVVSDAFWRSALGSDPNVIGRQIDIVHRPFTIVGVIDRRYFGLDVGQTFDVAIPATASSAIFGQNYLSTPQLFWLTAIGRMRTGESLAAAEARLKPAQDQAIRDAGMPETIATSLLKSSWRLLPTASVMAGARVSYQRPLLILLGITTIVLLVACVNIANLLTARAVSRRGELAVRLSLGASRAHLIRQLVLEAVTLAAAGTLAGIAAGVAGGRALIWLLSTSRNPIHLDLNIDWRVATFAAGAGAITAIVAAVLPAWRSTSVDPIEAIKARAPGVIGMRRIGVGHVLIGSQIALTFVLVLGGLVFSTSLVRLMNEDLGFDRGRVLLVGVRGATGSPTPVTALAPALEERLRAVPGVEDAAYSLMAPFGTVDFITYASVTGPQTGRKSWPESFHTRQNQIGPNYFQTMGMRILAGRAFSGAADRADAVIVNPAFARKFFNGEMPLGRTVWIGLEQKSHEVIGVVSDTKVRSLRDEPPPMVYLPWQKDAMRSTYVQLAVRSSRVTPSAAAMAEAIERMVPGAALEVRFLDVEVADTITTERATAMLAFLFALSGLLLAAVGLYGVLSREVHVRRPEIAVRMALGAAPRRVGSLVVFRIVAATVAGLIAGVGLSVAAEQVVRSLLYEVQPSDAGQLVTCIAIIAAVVVAAVAAPVRRATRVDPMTVLRSE